MTTYDLPLPGNVVSDDSEQEWTHTVIASTYVTDYYGGLLVLAKDPPYYAYGEIDLRANVFVIHETFPNIIPATDHYEEVTGCY